MSTGGGGGPGWAKGQFTENCEMNVTPFVDVMLVLLIIFMVAAPLATVTIPVDLPPSSASPPPQLADPVFVSIQAGGEVYVQEDRVTIENLADVVVARTKGNREERIYLRADERIIYRFVMDVMNRLQDAGFYKVALVAEEVQGS